MKPRSRCSLASKRSSSSCTSVLQGLHSARSRKRECVGNEGTDDEKGSDTNEIGGARTFRRTLLPELQHAAAPWLFAWSKHDPSASYSHGLWHGTRATLLPKRLVLDFSTCATWGTQKWAMASVQGTLRKAVNGRSRWFQAQLCYCTGGCADMVAIMVDDSDSI